MSETELGNLTIVSPSMPPLTSISSASVNRVSNFLTSSLSLTQCTPQEINNITENGLRMMERNTPSLLGETLNRFIEAQITSREQVRNEGTYSTRWSPTLDASQSDIDDGSECDFVYHNPLVVTENQRISSQIREASLNVKD